MSTNWTNNLTAYFYVYKIRIQKSLAYHFDVYGNIFMQCIIMFSTACFWRALYSVNSVVQGVEAEQMYIYTVVSTGMSVFFMNEVEHRVMHSVEKGTISVEMLKPISLYGIFFFEDLGKLTALLFQNLLPILFIGSFFIAVPKPVSATAFLLFLTSLIMAYLIHWLLAACFSMWAFVTIDMVPLLQVKKHLVRLLSGSIIPLWFFPDWLAAILNYLPFVYIYQLPLDIYIGKEEMKNLIPRMGIQISWVVVLFVLFTVLQKRILRKIMIQGG